MHRSIFPATSGYSHDKGPGTNCGVRVKRKHGVGALQLTRHFELAEVVSEGLRKVVAGSTNFMKQSLL